MNALLDSQLFERFLEERTTNPTQPEVRFFDESIAAKLNRSKTNPIKRDTPFLNDVSDAHSQASAPSERLLGAVPGVAVVPRRRRIQLGSLFPIRFRGDPRVALCIRLVCQWCALVVG